MSIIVGVIKENRISIASDTQNSRGSLKILNKYTIDSSKLIKFNDTLIGVTGWLAMDQVFRHILETKPDIFDFSSRSSIFESLLRMQRLLEDEYYLEPDESDDQPVNSNQMDAIIANTHGLFDIGSYREVTQFSKFWAIGSGERFALGAMYALYDKEYSSEEIAEAGVKAGCEFDDGCSTPLIVETIEI